MGKSIPYDYRVKIVQRRKRGESAKSIAATIPYSLSAVNKLWARYQAQGELAFQTNYSNSGRTREYGKGLEDLVDEVRDNSQGANYVVCKLQQKHPEKKIPSTRTLQRRWLEQGTNLPQGRPAKDSTEKKIGQTKHITPGK